jgi:hypothetical protein
MRDYEKLRREQAKRGGLLPFIRHFWHVLEPPKRKLIEGWPLEARCLQLGARPDYPRGRGHIGGCSGDAESDHA